MKAFLLVAGKGTRLKPLTDVTPKCLVPIKGVPLLAIWLKLCHKYGIIEVLVNLHHMADVVRDYLDNNDFGVKVTKYYEPELLGSAGTVWARRDFVEGQQYFFIIYGDNLTNMNLDKMAGFHQERNGILTMGLYRANEPEKRGIAELDSDCLIQSFVEKPSAPKSNLANAGIYIARTELFDCMPQKGIADFGFDVLPKLVGRMFGYKIDEYLMDIGSMANYQLANQEWSGL